THMVFLPVTAHNAVYRCRCTQLLVLAHYSCCGVLGYHKPAVQPCVWCQEGWQVTLPADQQVSTAFRYIGQFCHGYGQEIKMQCQGLPVEVATTHNGILIMKNNRIICYRIDLCFYYIVHGIHYIFGSTMHLWHAAERIRILYLYLGLLLYFASL